MNFLENIRTVIMQLFGIDPVTTQTEANILTQQGARYRDPTGYNMTAIFAGKLSTLTVTESTIEVTGGNARAELLSSIVQPLWRSSRKWVSTAFGTGGVILLPYVTGGKIFIDTVPQSSMLINRVNGDELRAVSIIADTTVVDDKRYFRYTDYSLDGTTLIIRQRATNAAGSPVRMSTIPAWAEIPDEFAISGADRLPLAFLKCPVDSRHTKDYYGAPITFGCDDKIAEITECFEDIRREYKLKKPIVGMDSTLFDVKNGRRNLPVTGLFMPTMPRGLDNSGKLWEVYDPDIRESAYYSRLQHLYEELEKQVGTSRGILTEPSSHGATATEIKAANYDTYAIIDTMRTAIAGAMDDLVDALDILINAYNLAPMGEHEISIDWSYSMIESSQESFNQLISGVGVGAIEPAEVRMFIYADETIDEARAACAQIASGKTSLADQLLRDAMIRDSREPVTLEEPEPAEE